MNKIKLKKPKEIVKIYEHPGYIDRYEFVIDGNDYWEYEALHCSPNPDSPQGVSTFGKGLVTENEIEVSWGKVPDNVQKHVIERLN